jgi:hypothetical protein
MKQQDAMQDATSGPQDHLNIPVLPDKLRRRLTLTRLEMACIAFIVLIATAFVAPALRPGYTLLPLQWVSRLLPWSTYIDEPLQNTTLGDPFFAFYPRRLFFTESIRSGELPFWNPYVLGGYPAVGDTNAQTFYPFNLLAAFIFSAARSFSVLAWFHLALTGVLMFVMLRSYRLHPASSLFGAISWMLSGIIVVWLEHPHRLSSFAWLPGLFWLFNLGDQRRRLVFPILGGLVFSLMILGGQPQYAALGGLLLGVYAISRSVKIISGKLRWGWWPFASLALIAFIGLGLGSLQLLPTYEFLTQSHRQPRVMQVWLLQALPLRHLTTFWLPNLFGSAEVGRYPYWGKMNYVEYTFYFGILPFLLCPLAPILSREKRVAWLWSAVVILTTLVALGSPLTYLVKWVPGMSYFSLHRIMSHVPFLGSWLAALALDAIINQSKEPHVLRWLLICSSGLLLATGVALYAYRLEVWQHWEGVAPELLCQGCVLALGVISLALMRRWRWIGLLAVLLITTADLFLWGWTFNPVSGLDLLYPENDVTDWFKQDTSLYRVLPLRHEERIFGENVLSIFHISAPDGYLAMTLRYHKELMYTIDPYFDDQARRFIGPHINLIVVQNFHPLHGMLNVKYVLSNVPLEAAQLRYVTTLHKVHIYENQDVLPRAYVVHRAEVVPEDKVLDVIASPAWDFHTKVLIPEPLTSEQQIALDRSPVQDDSHARITQYTPGRVRLVANMEHAGLLVLADPFCLGWHATVDGKPVEIIRANHALRTLFLNAGEHYIEFIFYPRSVIVSAFIAIAVCIVGLVLVIMSLRRRCSHR